MIVTSTDPSLVSPQVLTASNSFPYPSNHSHANLLSTYWRFIHGTPDGSTYTLGHITTPVFIALQSLPQELSYHPPHQLLNRYIPLI